MKIPSTFSMLGHKWRVEIIHKDDWPYGENVGNSDFQRLRLEILAGPATFMEQTFLHEMIHAALDYMGQTKLSKDEPFVDLLAGLLHQALESGE